MQLSLLEPPPPIQTNSRPAKERLTRETILPYLPEASAIYILSWFEKNPVRFRLAPQRFSKFGDYRPAKNDLSAIISVNRNLNPFDFLITLVHEMAHDVIFTRPGNSSGMFFKRRKNRPRPHGNEWKEAYYGLMIPLMIPEIFPDDILEALVKYFEKPAISHNASQHLTITLKKYDQPDGKVFVKDLDPDEVFYLSGGQAFRILDKVRKRFRCQSLTNRRIYLFSPVVRVNRIKT